VRFNKSMYGGINFIHFCKDSHDFFSIGMWCVSSFIFFHNVQDKICYIFYCNNKQKDMNVQYDMLCLIFIASNKLDHTKGILFKYIIS